MRRRLVILAALTATIGFTPGAAAADPQPPNVWAAAAQYVEMIPTSTGPKAIGSAGARKPLPRRVARQIAERGGTDAQALETLVTSSAWGASTASTAGEAGKPAATRPESGEKPVAPERRPGPALAVPPPSESTSVADGAGGALTSGGRATFALVAVLVMLAAFTLVRLRQGRR